MPCHAAAPQDADCMLRPLNHAQDLHGACWNGPQALLGTDRPQPGSTAAAEQMHGPAQGREAADSQQAHLNYFWAISAQGLSRVDRV